MQVNICKLERNTLESFADKHGLTMDIHERATGYTHFKWYARFKNCEVKEGCILSAMHGNGATPEEAMRDYAQSISGKRLIVDALTPNRRDLQVPFLEGIK